MKVQWACKFLMQNFRPLKIKFTEKLRRLIFSTRAVHARAWCNVLLLTEGTFQPDLKHPRNQWTAGLGSVCRRGTRAGNYRDPRSRVRGQHTVRCGGGWQHSTAAQDWAKYQRSSAWNVAGIASVGCLSVSLSACLSVYITLCFVQDNVEKFLSVH